MTMYLDDVDVPLFEKYDWHANQYGYATAKMRDGNYLFHRKVMRLKKRDGKVVDHINGDRLDNRRSNLRIVTAQESALNRKKYSRMDDLPTGVYRYGMKRFYAMGFLNKKRYHIGYFDDPIEAGKAVVEWKAQNWPKLPV